MCSAAANFSALSQGTSVAQHGTPSSLHGSGGTIYQDIPTFETASIITRGARRCRPHIQVMQGCVFVNRLVSAPAVFLCHVRDEAQLAGLLLNKRER